MCATCLHFHMQFHMHASAGMHANTVFKHAHNSTHAATASSAGTSIIPFIWGSYCCAFTHLTQYAVTLALSQVGTSMLVFPFFTYMRSTGLVGVRLAQVRVCVCARGVFARLGHGSCSQLGGHEELHCSPEGMHCDVMRLPFDSTFLSHGCTGCNVGCRDVV